MKEITDVHELIRLLQDDACHVAVETNVYPSVYLAVAIYEYKKYGDYFIIENKNPYNSFMEENTYFSYKDAMRKFSLVNQLYSKKLLTESNTLKKIYTDDSIISNILTLSVQYNLNIINAKFLSSIFDGNIIDINKESKINLYFVKRISNNTTLLRTMDLTEAKTICNRNVGSVVMDTKGKIVYGEKIKDNIVSKGIQNISLFKDYTIGTKISLLNANLYKTKDSKVPIRSISGTYIISSNVLNNRYKISSVFDNEFIIGYININEIEKIK